MSAGRVCVCLNFIYTWYVTSYESCGRLNNVKTMAKLIIRYYVCDVCVSLSTRAWLDILQRRARPCVFFSLSLHSSCYVYLCFFCSSSIRVSFFFFFRGAVSSYVYYLCCSFFRTWVYMFLLYISCVIIWSTVGCRFICVVLLMCAIISLQYPFVFSLFSRRIFTICMCFVCHILIVHRCNSLLSYFSVERFCYYFLCNLDYFFLQYKYVNTYICFYWIIYII